MKKSNGTAIASFIFGLFFWIPLINFIFAIPAIYFGIKALKNIRQDKSYGGKWFAITGIILGALVYVTYLTGLGMCMFGFKEICKNIGLTFLT